MAGMLEIDGDTLGQSQILALRPEDIYSHHPNLSAGEAHLQCTTNFEAFLLGALPRG